MIRIRKTVDDKIDKDVDQEEAERRSIQDRRDFLRTRAFPIRLKSGIVVAKDRRKTPDRRLNNIEALETELDEEEFQRYMQKFL